MIDKKNRNLHKQRTDNISTNLPELNKDLANRSFAEPTPNFSSAKVSKD